MDRIKITLNSQKKFFLSRKTYDVNYRIDSLLRLKNIIKANEERIIDALQKDLGKSPFESYTTEIGIVYDEINYHIKNIKRWSKPIKKKTSMLYFPAKSYIYKEPYGVVLIIGPFNYPFQLLINPLIGAISSGNCSILKPSEQTPTISKLLEEIVNNNFEEHYIRVVDPLEGKKVVSYLLDLNFDYIFFTGSVAVGKVVMEKASKNLIPVTLELGGKSPCIVDKDVKIDIAAKRLVWGKFLNVGQTCVAPDYLYIHSDIKEKFLKALRKEIKSQFGDDIKLSKDLGRIVNRGAIDRFKNYLGCGTVYFGGNYDYDELYFEPTILTDVNINSEVMKDEIFGPILPVLEFNNLSTIITEINVKQKPLALYYFSESKKSIDKVLEETSSGGVTINDTIIHVASKYIPFGGVGTSGIGSYHGKESFNTFTHNKAVLRRGTFIEFPFRFAPYRNKIGIIRKLMK